MLHLKCSSEKDCPTVNPNVYGESQSLIEIDKMSLYTTLQEDMDTRMVRPVIAADKITTRKLTGAFYANFSDVKRCYLHVLTVHTSPTH